ncbi:acetyl-CoA hydrolase/transferase family protein [Corticibacter populi]|uniref:Acetyl-CoA hydrolase/transferase family protein n=1 Tax=Corticibacter populi TaxID=1550736 RepID=A0A3M6QP20_9BURK|nr:acetyl-CoA hydrolase/transferase family protein [Corticibacter populi]RMX04796.1 acetyl-CoA hydrolase/transferase family protein [Corticibacter populi]RZS33792.1 succinyl-CoA:acetate CoA-transferase [Corticibacter populi]
MPEYDRIQCPAFKSKIMSADAAAALIPEGCNVGMSGFTGSGAPKEVPMALARRIEAQLAQGHHFKIGMWTGASTGPEIDGALAKVNGINMRLPYQSDPTSRERINQGDINYIDMHLSHVAQYVWFGFFGKLNVALIEVAGILPDGRLIPSTSVGNNKTWLDQADLVILEVNERQPLGLAGMHDVYYGTQLPPHRVPIPLVHPHDRIGEPYLRCDPAKVIAVVPTHKADRNSPFKPADADSEQIAGHLIDFFKSEVRHGRLPKSLLPLQSGVGNIANAVLAGLNNGPFENLTAFTEVMQDGMLAMLRSGKMVGASATGFSLSPEGEQDFVDNIDFYRDKIVLRPQEMSNHPELIRRLGVIAMNAMIEADIYGNVNSTHVMGSSIMNGIGGSGDFARNAYLSIFMAKSSARGGDISCIVPAVSHVDHTEHDVQILVTERGLADLRGLAPKQRARLIIDNCSAPEYRPMLQEYFERALHHSRGKHTPMLLDEALSWHARFERTGSMKVREAVAA